MEGKRIKTVIIGSGNVATHLARALKEHLNIVQIFSRNISNAQNLAQSISKDCKYTNSQENLLTADLYIISIKDDAISGFLTAVPDSLKNSIWVHTSGSTPMSVFDGFNEAHGVVYPLQTFSKNVDIAMRDVSFFVEGSSKFISDALEKIFLQISDHVFYADSETRCQLHIAAVFSCNFTNYMYTIANDILKRHNIPFSVLTPLIEETLRKAENNPPDRVQTGPAVRNDRNILNKHLSLLRNEEQELYKLISESIIKRYNRI